MFVELGNGTLINTAYIVAAIPGEKEPKEGDWVDKIEIRDSPNYRKYVSREDFEKVVEALKKESRREKESKNVVSISEFEPSIR